MKKTQKNIIWEAEENLKEVWTKIIKNSKKNWAEKKIQKKHKSQQLHCNLQKLWKLSEIRHRNVIDRKNWEWTQELQEISTEHA